MSNETTLERRGHVGIITMNREQALNAHSVGLMQRFREIIREVNADAGVRVVIITGAGEKAFCAGADLRERDGFTPAQMLDMRVNVMFPFFRDLDEMMKPSIAAVNGVAFGGGCEIALACDLRLAAEHAQFGQREVKWGIIPAGGACERLPLLVGLGKAKELVLTGRIVKADEALAIGMVNEVAPKESLMSRALELAEEIAANAPLAVQQAKRVMDIGANLRLARSLAMEASHFCYLTEDQREGIAAFNEKRPPSYQGM